MSKDKYEIKEIPVQQIYLDDSLRIHEDGVKFREALGDCLEEIGLQAPIYVRQMERNRYLLIDGWDRLAIWKIKWPDRPIRCRVRVPEEVQNGNLANEVTDRDRQEAMVTNAARHKVSKKKLDAYVWRLHCQGMGYQQIARHILRSKSWVQQAVNRQKNESVESARSEEVSIREIRRTRTILSKLKKMLAKRGISFGEHEDVFEKMDTFLEEQLLALEQEASKGDEWHGNPQDVTLDENHGQMEAQKGGEE